MSRIKMVNTLKHKITARFRKNPAFSFLLEATGNKLNSKKWIFILGCYNSGTTLLNQILADHPSISGLPDEGVMLTDKLKKPEDFGWRRMWYKCEKEMSSFNGDKSKISTGIKKHWSHFYDDTEFLVEKSIPNACRIPFFEEDFQPAYFIHIVRNGYAVAEGIRRKAAIMKANPFYGEKHYPIDLCARQWTRHLEVVEEQKKNLTNYLEISYESFSEDPVGVMKEITKFLNIKDYQENYFENSFSVHEKDSEIRNMNLNSFNRLSNREIKTISNIAGEYLRKYGYEIMKL